MKTVQENPQANTVDSMGNLGDSLKNFNHRNGTVKLKAIFGQEGIGLDNSYENNESYVRTYFVLFVIL